MIGQYKKKPPVPPGAPAERRRIGTVVRDERGNAIVNWRDAPLDHERPVLAIEGQAPPGRAREAPGFDPYARRLPDSAPRRGTRTDLRKLSEWIKMMRELEQRRRQGDAD